MNVLTIDRRMAEFVKAELKAIPLANFPLLPDQTYRNAVGFRAKKALQEIGKEFHNVWDGLAARHAYGRILMQPDCSVSTHNLVIKSLNALIQNLYVKKSEEHENAALPPPAIPVEGVDYKRAYEDLKADWDYQQNKVADYDRIKLEIHDVNRNMERVLAQNSFIIEQYKNIEKHSKQYVFELKMEIDVLRSQLRK